MTENSTNLNDINTFINEAKSCLDEYSVDTTTVSSSDSLTDEEIDRQIDASIEHTNKLMGIWEQYTPSSHYYRRISDELGGKKITANGLKYPYEIIEKDLFFPSSEEQPDLHPSGEITNAN